MRPAPGDDAPGEPEGLLPATSETAAARADWKTHRQVPARSWKPTELTTVYQTSCTITPAPESGKFLAAKEIPKITVGVIRLPV
jgi:hypothetical protein